jgi:DNA-binding NarL/FixJ family response regulator
VQSVGILVRSTYVEADFAETLLNDSDGRSGYLLKDRVADLDELAGAIRRIARGGVVIDPASHLPLTTTGVSSPCSPSSRAPPEREALPLE